MDPTQYSSGTDISFATPGVVLSNPSNPGSPDVVSVPLFTGDPNGSFIGSGSPGSYNSVFTQTSPLKALFTSPVSSITVDFTFGGFPGDSGFGEIEAFSAMGTPMGTAMGGPDPSSITIFGGGVSYIDIFTGNTAGYDVVGISGISFTPAGAMVPDAASTGALLTVALTACGCASRAVRRR